MSGGRALSERDYARLLAVRTRLRRFERWSAEQAATQELTASQHQLLLAVRGHDGLAGPTIGDVAEYLMIKHNTAVGLVDRTAEAGLLERVRDPSDHRIVRLKLSRSGSRRLAALSAAHLAELSQLAPLFEGLLSDLREP